MDYEKKYNDIIARLKTMASVQPDITKQAIISLFPELKESEDERMMNQLHSWMKEFGGAEEYTEKVYNWLQGLIEKQGEQKPWSEEDEKKITYLDGLVGYQSCLSSDEKKDFYRWFKSLKNRVGCESNCTTTKGWSEEDLYMQKQAIRCVNNSGKLEVSTGEIEDWLKSLSPQNRWKPSDEQIKAVRLARTFVVDDFDENPTLSEILVELEKQLKKLREE